MPVELLGLFFASAVLLAITPGPDNLFVLAQSLAHGSRAGLVVVIGLCTGLVLHTSLVALGLAALLAASPWALWTIRLIGACYLLYLAWQSWNSGSERMGAAQSPRLTVGRLYRRGIIMNATNPKVILFFLAFLPQFVDVSRGPIAMQITILGGLFMLATLLVFGGIALLAGGYSERINGSPQRQRLLHRGISLLFLLLALNLFFAWI